LATYLFKFTYSNLDSPWTSIRLAPTFALWKGYPLYSTTTQPPWVMVGYGPLYPLMYTPALFASTPGPAVAIATVLAHIFILLPLCLLIRLASSGKNRPWLQAIMVTVLLYPLFILIPSLRYITTAVHVDAPALGLMLISAWFLLQCTVGERPGAQRAACLAGVSLGLAIACKANIAAAIFVFAGWCYWFHGLRAMASLLVCAGTTVVGIYAFACIFNDPQAILMNFRVLGNFPWAANIYKVVIAPEDKSWVLGQKMIGILREAGPVVLAVAISLRTAMRGMANRHLPATAAPVLAVFFLLLSLTMLLPAGASVAKLWGDINSWALFTLPLTLSAVFTLVHIARGVVSVSHPYLMILCLPGILVGLMEARPWQVGQLVGGIPTTTLEESYRLVMQCKGTCYLPADPLAHMLAGDTFRPSLDVISSYKVGGYPVDQKAFAAALPKNLSHIYMPNKPVGNVNELMRLSKYLPQKQPDRKNLKAEAQEFHRLFLVFTATGEPEGIEEQN
jgi:hypothetical protein